MRDLLNMDEASMEPIVARAKEFVKRLMIKNDPSHDFAHVERVWKNAVHLARKEPAKLDMLVVHLAALFHDAVDFKYDFDKTKSLEQIARERLAEFFDAEQVTPEQRERVLKIVLNLSWRKELEDTQGTIEYFDEMRVVQDADRLDAIGAVGVARCFAFSGAKMRPFYLADRPPIANMTHEQYNRQTVLNESTAVNHFYEKLLLIKEKMKTEEGKRLAEQRHTYMLTFLEQFNMECHL